MITRDDNGAVVLVETTTASVRECRGVLYIVLTDRDGGEYRVRYDSDLGLSAWHKPPARSADDRPTSGSVLRLVKE
tara:strand:+ start:340 stop:567 length:228 start_codon:yes stop_codon:yes gene_type:complete